MVEMCFVRRFFSAIFLLVAYYALSGCSSLGSVYLLNRSGEKIKLVVSDDSYEIANGEIKEVRVDPIFGGNKFRVSSSTADRCYLMPKVNPDWIKPGFSHARVLAVIDEYGRIYLVSPKNDEKSFGGEPFPKQPDSFPLESLDASECIGGGAAR